MKKYFLAAIMAIFIVTIASAQDYKTGVGLRGGLSSGLTIKHFISSNKAIEGLIATRWQGLELTGLYEVHNNAFDVDRLNWYYGGGAHLGFWDGNSSWGNLGQNYTVLGIDGILGIEYNFSEAPINIGLDWKPAFNLTGYSGFWGDGGALSIRYIF